MKTVLASGSPRRRELLSVITPEFEICPAQGEEKCGETGPRELVTALASAKAEEVAAKFPADTLVIAADTIVWADSVFGKPSDEDDARRMLRALSGRTHEVYTGVCLIRDGKCLCDSVCTRVRFRELSDAEINAYIATGEPMDKAGAYGIQGKAALFVEGIDGDYYNVMGLPLCRLGQMIHDIGV